MREGRRRKEGRDKEQKAGEEMAKKEGISKGKSRIKKTWENEW